MNQQRRAVEMMLVYAKELHPNLESVNSGLEVVQQLLWSIHFILLILIHDEIFE